MSRLNVKHLIYFSLCLGLLYAFSSSHPVSGSGYTGAPGDGVCGSCHSGNNSALTGDILIEGIPSTLDPGTSVPVTVRVTNPSANAARAGFQLTALDQNDDPVGSIINIGASASLKTAGTQEYVGHQPSVNFSGGDVTWTFDFELPSNVGAATDVTFYGSAIIANGGNGNNNDRFVLTSESASINVVSSPLDVMITSSADSPCFDIDGGSASASASGGVTPYTFAWSNGETGSTAIALPAGQVATVTVTDAASNTASTNVAIGSPPLLELDVINQAPAPCDGLTGGSATVAGSGGVGSYVYSWPGGLTGPQQNNLNVGVYEVTVTDNNNCDATATVSIDAIPILTLSTTTTDVSCNAGADGQIDITASGGTTPYLYSWNDGPTAEDRSGLAAGQYTVTITDDNGCTLEETFSILEPDELVVNGSTADVTCFGDSDGAILVTASGGTSPYTYQWSNAGTSDQITNLQAGSYTVTVTDANGCSNSSSYNISEPDDIVVTVLETQDVTCAGGSDGFVSITVTGGGTSPFSFTWSDGGDGTGLSTGNYTVTVSDANNCTTVRNYFIGEIAQPLVVAVSTTSVSAAGAADGSATAFAVGGVMPYSYLWNTGDTIVGLTGLASGNYSVTVTDSLGCTAQSEGFVGDGDCLLNATADVTPNLCAGDSTASIALTVNNAVGSASYTWSTGDTTSSITDLPAGQYSVTVSDEGDCTFAVRSIMVVDPPMIGVSIIELSSLQCIGEDATLTYSVDNQGALDSVIWSTGSSSDSITIMQPGTYIITAIDTFGCSEMDTIVVDGQDMMAPLIVIQVDPVWYIDQNGNLTTDTSAVLIDIVDDCTIDSTSFSIRTDSLQGCDLVGNSLVADIYARDSQGNVSIDSVIIDVLDTLGPVATITLDTLVFGNCDIVSYTTPSFTDNCSAVTTVIDTMFLGSQLAIGNYEISVTATDIYGNTTITSIPLQVIPSLDVITSISDISCNGENDGSFTVDSIAGYFGDFTVELAGTVVPVDLGPGIYGYTVTDTSGCSVTDSFEIFEPSPLLLDTFVLNDASDSTARNGSVGIQVVGGTGRITYSWTNELGEVISTNSFAAGLQAGEYTVDIMDDNGCLLVETFIVGFPGSTSVTELNDSEWSTYPNPTSDYLLIEGIKELFDIQLVSADGRTVWTQSYDSQKVKIDVSGFAAGVYAVRVITSSGLVGQRNFVILH